MRYKKINIDFRIVPSRIITMESFFSVDPWAGKYLSWSTYNYTMSNPVMLIDPSGKGPEDVIKIYKSGKIERTAAPGDDKIVNEDGSKEMIIPLLNGESQIRNLSTIPFISQGQNSRGEYYTSFQIDDYSIATSVFEFMALNSDAEFAQESYKFSDGFATSIIGTSGASDVVASYGQVYGNGRNLSFGTGMGEHIQSEGVFYEHSHSHPDATWQPSGFNGYLGKDQSGNFTIPIMQANGLPEGDANFNKIYSPQNSYVFSKYLYQMNNGGGYIKYDSKQAKYTGTKSN